LGTCFKDTQNLETLEFGGTFRKVLQNVKTIRHFDKVSQKIKTFGHFGKERQKVENICGTSVKCPNSFKLLRHFLQSLIVSNVRGNYITL
jgi:hypothetical protein